MIGIIGGGAFGTALASVYSRAGIENKLWLRNQDHISALKNQSHPKLPSISIPKLSITDDINEFDKVEILLFALPAQITFNFIKEHHHIFAKEAHFVMAAKGIDRKTGLFQTEIVKEIIGKNAAAISGPGFAVDIADNKPTAFSIAHVNSDISKWLQTKLSTDSLRLYRTSDVKGVELGGAFKNIISIGAGVTIGANLGESARAALIARGFREMQEITRVMGGKPETLMGLSGLGDLILSATSATSRNTQLGIAIGKGETLDPNITTEGAYTAEIAEKLAHKFGLETPITSAIVKLINGTHSVKAIMTELFERPLKEE